MEGKTLNSKQIRKLRGLAHHLNPLVQLGKTGMTPALIKEVDRNLEDHELIKVRVTADDRFARQSLVEELIAVTRATEVQVIGNVAVLYRQAKEPTIVV